ncbi:MAG: M14 family zinc carboxypeptidase, partial [Bacteroidota bacterium]|nr:M14 family zinc carboxypeptidase [Bacteroidota bacterium]
MTGRFSIILLLLSFLFQFSFSQEAWDHKILLERIAKKGQAEVSIPYQGQKETDVLTRNVSIRSVRNNRIYIVLSSRDAEWFISKKYKYSIIEREEAKGIRSASSVSEAMQWESYPTYTQYDSIMRAFASEYPTLCRLDTIGTSIRGRLVLVLKITGNTGTGDYKPPVFYTSSIHGDETGGFILMMRFAEYLLKNYNTDSRIRELIDNLEIWINPLANPDGTYYGSNSIISPTRNNANGYDLNRNFPDPEVSNITKQKETIDMMRFLAKHRFVLSANFHSGEEVVNYPWDRWARLHADNDWFYGISRKYADTVHTHSPKGYMDFLDNGVTNGYEWYPVYGGRQDYVTWSLNGREVTIELDTNYVAPVSYLDNLWQYNKQSLTGYLENALYGIHGHVSDLYSDDPVPAMVFIDSHDKDNSQVYSDTLTGGFVRLLKPGIWNLTFSARGYRDTTLTNITVTESTARNLLVKMTPLSDTTGNEILLLYPNPAGSGVIYASLPSTMRGKSVNIRIYNLAGAEVADYNTNTSETMRLS